jgi:hypothetical protein
LLYYIVKGPSVNDVTKFLTVFRKDCQKFISVVAKSLTEPYHLMWRNIMSIRHILKNIPKSSKCLDNFANLMDNTMNTYPGPSLLSSVVFNRKVWTELEHPILSKISFFWNIQKQSHLPHLNGHSPHGV